MMLIRSGLLVVVTLLPVLATAQEGEEKLLSLSLEDLSQLEVNIATGTPKTLSEAPAVASVVTAQDIQAMGAQTQDEALAGVPGLHVSPGSFFYGSRYLFRGIYSNYNPETLVLVNGVPMTSLWLGDRSPAWQGVPVNAIARIEVVRGPGSAVYGADAFAGVINIVTKSPEDIPSNGATVSHGSADTTRAGLQQRGQFGEVKAALFLNYLSTAGDKGIITSDAQSNIDALHLAPPASLAPGSVNRGLKSADARLELDWRAWRLRAAWQQLWDVGTAQGLINALDPVGRFGANYGDLDLSWHDPGLSDRWDLSGLLSYSHKAINNEAPAQDFPPGAFFGSFPQGVLTAPSIAEENARSEFTAIYSGLQAHRLRLGTGFFWGEIYDTKEIKNFDASHAPLIVPLPGGMTNVSGTPVVVQPTARRSDAYALVQDEWTLAPRWALTTGLRQDHYSDFGSTSNPRAALVWQTTPEFTSKLLYGQAFRAPSMAELYVTHNPLAEGNPGLKPEKLRSTELAFAWHPPAPWSMDLNLYQFRISDFIEYAPAPSGTEVVAQNIGNFIGEGMESEGRWQPAKPLQLLLNYSHQHIFAMDSGAPLGGAPRDQAYARVIWDFEEGWQLTPQLTWVGSRPRAAGDPRDALHGYTTLDLTLRRQLPHEVEIALIGHNLGNADVREPSNPVSGQTQPAIPFDLPEPGRTLFVELNAHW